MMDENVADEGLTDEDLAACERVCDFCKREGIALEDLIYYASRDKLASVMDAIRQDERDDTSVTPLTEDEFFELGGLVVGFVQDREIQIWEALSDELPDLIKNAQERDKDGSASSTGSAFLDWVGDSANKSADDRGI